MLHAQSPAYWELAWTHYRLSERGSVQEAPPPGTSPCEALRLYSAAGCMLCGWPWQLSCKFRAEVLIGNSQVLHACKDARNGYAAEVVYSSHISHAAYGAIGAPSMTCGRICRCTGLSIGGSARSACIAKRCCTVTFKRDMG